MLQKTTRFGLFFVLCSLFFYSTTSAQLVTKSVDDGSDGTLRQEIADTPAGGTITFAAGVETIALTSELLIEKELTISADSTARVTIDAQTQSRIFNITAGPVTFNHLDLVNGFIFQGNVGGGIKALAADVNLFDTNITNCQSLSGGGVYIQEAENFVVSGGTMQGNLGFDEGGAFYINAENTKFEDVLIDRNGSDDAGAGIFNSGGDLQILGSTISNNTFTFSTAVSIDGAGIYNSGGNLVIKNSTFTKNDSRSEGGALYMKGSGFATIGSCEFSDNFTGNEGGAIWNDTATINIKTSTISGNYTSPSHQEQPSEGKGGGIYNNAGSMYIDASTLVLNKSENKGGGIYNASAAATTTLKNSIVALNTAAEGNNFAGEISFVSADYNLIGEDSLSVFPAMSNDLEGNFESPLDPMIDSLANNGDFTQTHALLDGSPAYNAGNPIDNFPDQRGEAVFGGRRDIGAFEAQTNLGTEDIIAASGKSLLYPNPSKNGFVQLNIPDSETSEIRISVIEIGSGKVVISQTGKSGLNTLKTEGLQAGTYIVRLVSNKNVQSLKMLVAN